MSRRAPATLPPQPVGGPRIVANVVAAARYRARGRSAVRSGPTPARVSYCASRSG
jgi:hypothetical protein